VIEMEKSLLATSLLRLSQATFFFRSAQRFFIASPIRFLAAADSVRLRLRPSGLPVTVRVFLLPRNAAMAWSRRSRSAVSSAIISAVFNGFLHIDIESFHNDLSTNQLTHK
jgi:hypothetical protein